MQTSKRRRINKLHTCRSCGQVFGNVLNHERKSVCGPIAAARQEPLRRKLQARIAARDFIATVFG